MVKDPDPRLAPFLTAVGMLEAPLDEVVEKNSL